MESTVTLTGYVGNNIELKKTRSGVSYANLRVGTTPRTRRGTEWVDMATVWTTVMCYRSLADNVASSVSKGDPVVINGHVRTQVWIDTQNETHERTLVEATTIGHDLNRGSTVFRRSVPRASENETMPPEGETPPMKDPTASHDSFHCSELDSPSDIEID